MIVKPRSGGGQAAEEERGAQACYRVRQVAQQLWKDHPDRYKVSPPPTPPLLAPPLLSAREAWPLPPGVLDWPCCSVTSGDKWGLAVGAGLHWAAQEERVPEPAHAGAAVAAGGRPSGGAADPHRANGRPGRLWGRRARGLQGGPHRPTAGQPAAATRAGEVHGRLSFQHLCSPPGAGLCMPDCACCLSSVWHTLGADFGAGWLQVEQLRLIMEAASEVAASRFREAAGRPTEVSRRHTTRHQRQAGAEH